VDHDGDGFGSVRPDLRISSCTKPTGYAAGTGDCFDNVASVTGCFIEPLSAPLTLLDSFTSSSPSSTVLVHDRIYTPDGAFFMAMVEYNAAGCTATSGPKCALACYDATTFARHWHGVVCGGCPSSSALKIPAKTSSYFPAPIIVSVASGGNSATSSNCGLFDTSCTTANLASWYPSPNTNGRLKISSSATSYCKIMLQNTGGTSTKTTCDIGSNIAGRRVQESNVSFFPAAPPPPRLLQQTTYLIFREQFRNFSHSLWLALGAWDVSAGDCAAGLLGEDGSCHFSPSSSQCVLGGTLVSASACRLRMAPKWDVTAGDSFAACAAGDVLQLDVLTPVPALCVRMSAAAPAVAGSSLALLAGAVGGGVCALLLLVGLTAALLRRRRLQKQPGAPPSETRNPALQAPLAAPPPGPPPAWAFQPYAARMDFTAVNPLRLKAGMRGKLVS
jgi:hypothetical protein